MVKNIAKYFIGGGFVFGGLSLACIKTVGDIAEVDGPSMQPALNPEKGVSDYVFINKLPIAKSKISRGDIITFISPKDERKTLIKRVVGLENDVIQTKGYKTNFVRVPKGHCWVEGDNTGRTLDSNSFGPVSLDNITGKVTGIVWPPNRWQFLRAKKKQEVII